MPDGFHVTTEAHRRFLADGQLAPDLAAEILDAYHALGSPAVAVRSSATAEDQPGASYAGQHDSFLNVLGDAALLEAVRRCWASLTTERAIAYRGRAGTAEPAAGLAVVVQRLVAADAAGVMFTADPVTGDETTIAINAAWGLGEAVVGGQVTPDAFTVDRRSGRLIGRVINPKTIMTVRTPDGTAEQPVPEDRQRRSSLSERQIHELAQLGIRISAAVRPADGHRVVPGG